MKILLVVTSLNVGGAERLLTNLADDFVSAGHEVILVRFHGEAGLRPTDPRVRLENLQMRRSLFGVLAGMRRFRRVLREFCPDVVNSHLVHANILTRLLRIVTPMPRLVSSAHNTNEESRLRMLAYRLTDRFVDISTNVSSEAVQAFIDQKALKPGRMVTIPNGIDAQTFAFDGAAREQLRKELLIDGTVPVLLAVGRLREEKDYPNLLRALSALHRRFKRCPRVLIAGDGPLRDELQELAAALGVDSQVRFLGVRDDIHDLMSVCDVFVSASAWEGFGLVVAEAMACERVVVGTDSGGVRDVIGDAGLIVPRGDSDALADALEHALSLPDNAARQLGWYARRRVVEHYSIATTSKRYLAIFRDDESTAVSVSTTDSFVEK